MARNGTGTMAVINSFSANTTIESSKVNANFTDVASEITGSLPRDGQAAMTGQLKASSGTVAAPGITFSSDLDTGWYWISANNIGAAANGAKVLDVSTTGLDVTGTLSQGASPVVTSGNFGTGYPDLSAIEALSATSGLLKKTAANTWSLSGGIADLANSTAWRLGATNGSGSWTVFDVAAPLDLTAGFLNITAATTSATGTVRLADKAAMEAETANRVVTADLLHNGPCVPKAWGNVTVSGGTPTLNGNYGVSGVAKNSSGNFTVTLSPAMSNSSYCVVGNAGFNTTGGSSGNGMVLSITDLTTTTFRILTGDNNADSLSDAAFFTFMVMGDQ